MAGLSGELLRTGLALKVSQIKFAIRDYLHDRATLAQTTAIGYATAAALFAAAGVFLIAALLVGATALFRWIEINYGMFWAFGVVGGLLVAMAAACAMIAASRLKRPRPRFPGLTSRLRGAVMSNPVTPDRIETASDTARSILRAPPTPVTRHYRDREPRHYHNNRAALIMIATLMGWALARRAAAARAEAGPAGDQMMPTSPQR